MVLHQRAASGPYQRHPDDRIEHGTAGAARAHSSRSPLPATASPRDRQLRVCVILEARGSSKTLHRQLCRGYRGTSTYYLGRESLRLGSRGTMNKPLQADLPRGAGVRWLFSATAYFRCRPSRWSWASDRPVAAASAISSALPSSTPASVGGRRSPPSYSRPAGADDPV